MDVTRDLVGTSDLADQFDYSPSSIKLLDRLGIIPPSRKVAGRRVWAVEELPLIERAIKARREESGQAA